MFTSTVARDVYGGTKNYNGVQFHFHAGSEHTVDGKRMDLEMHTVHTAAETYNEIGFAAMGIMFSVNEHNVNLTWAERQIVDAFFDGLRWDETSGAVNVDMVLYGSLMEMVDSNKRWVYKGSVTTPPCGRFVYWNVLSTIYPVSLEVVQKFKNNQLNQGEGGLLDERGNFRVIQPVDDHDVRYIEYSPPY
jgi:carbonic anhydrase